MHASHRIRIEKELFSAIERLKAGRPKHPKLAEDAKHGTLKINVSTVALEADKSRTLIGFEECLYPKVREAVLDLKKNPSKKTAARRVTKKLRSETTLLSAQLKTADTANANLLLRIFELEENNRRMQGKLERLNDGLAEGNRDTASKVVPFARGKE